MKYETLFTPIRIGNMEVKNRLVVPPMGTNLCNEDNTVGDKFINYWSARAKGGWGLLIVEVTAIDPLGLAAPRVPALYDDKFIPGFKRLADKVHQYGAKICIQLHHAGRQISSKVIGDKPVAPSPIKCPLVQETPHELTTEEVYQLIEQFGDAALRAREAGIDGVEIHGAHGYLVAQFMSAYSNKRTDEFGGSLENRMRFPLEIIKNIKRKAGSDYPILFRISADEFVPGGRKINETRMIARMLEDAGVDCIHVSAGVYKSMQYIVAPSSVEPGYLLHFAEEVKKAVDIPVIGVGRITSAKLAEDAILTGKADLIAQGRQSLADPEYPNKIAFGNEAEVAPCIGCMQGCIGLVLAGNDVSCLVNPFCGNEGEMVITPAEEKKKVVIAGGGPAGLEAAWILAKRGHEVVLFEKEKELGGNYRIGAIPPAKQEILKALEYYKNMGEKYGVTYRLGVEATPVEIMEENPDVVIVATGAVEKIPNFPGMGSLQSHVMTASEVLTGEKDPTGKVLIIGGGMVGCETADFLGEYGYDITIVEMLPEVAKDVEPAVKYFLFERLKQNNVDILTNTKVKEIREEDILVEQDGKEVSLGKFDTIIVATGYSPNNQLKGALEDKVEVHVIGDALEVRQAIDAIRDAANLALNLEKMSKELAATEK